MTRSPDEPPLADPAYLRRPRGRRGHIHRPVLHGFIGATGFPGIALRRDHSAIHLRGDRASVDDARPDVHRGFCRGEWDRDILGREA